MPNNDIAVITEIKNVKLNMRHQPYKILTYLLVVLLLQVPLQPALGSVDEPVSGHEQHNGMTQMDAKSDCTKCKSDPNCNGHDCSSGHCSFCTYIVTAKIISALSPFHDTGPAIVGEVPVPHFTNSLYRPPKQLS